MHQVVATQIRHEAVRQLIPGNNASTLSADVTKSVKSLTAQLATLAKSFDDVVSRMEVQVRELVVVLIA